MDSSSLSAMDWTSPGLGVAVADQHAEGGGWDHVSSGGLVHRPTQASKRQDQVHSWWVTIVS